MEHFPCDNKECQAYMRDNQCMWRYGDNIIIDYKTCPRIVELLSTESNCDVNGWIHKEEMREYTVIEGDITKTDNVDFIAHQVNCMGKMGSGVAKALRTKYPMIYTDYMKICSSNLHSNLLGFTQYVQVNTRHRPFYVINMFTQENFGYDGKQYTSIEAFKKSLENINKNCANYTVAFPWKIGCVRGGANWDEVLPLICKTLTDVRKIIFYKL